MRALLLCLVLLLPAGPLAAQQTEPFRILNRTGQPATALYAVRAGRGDWGGNLLNHGPLPDGGAYRLVPNAGAGCRFDLRLVLADGREAVLRGQDVCTEHQTVLDAASARAIRSGAAAIPMAPNPRAGGGTGSGFAVALDAILTNQHVVDGCNRILVRTPDGRFLGATPPARVDRQLDLALLRVPGLALPPLVFRERPAVRRGEGVVVYGFPLSGLLSSDPKLTRGEVNGLNGLRDDPTRLQISAEVQPGNSGGPMLDMQGHVIGVVVAKLNAQAVARQTGDIAQNVNFAIKGSAAVGFLRALGVAPTLAESRGAERSAPDVGDIAQGSTVFVRCER